MQIRTSSCRAHANEFMEHRHILTDFLEWERNPDSQILTTKEHIILLGYLVSIFLRSFHRNANHRIVMKRSHTGSLKVIFQWKKNG